MSRGQIAILVAFGVIVAAIAAFVLPFAFGPQRPGDAGDASESDPRSPATVPGSRAGAASMDGGAIVPLDPGESVRVHVKDASGAPVPAAQVRRFGPLSVTAGADGDSLLHRRPYGAAFVSAAGHRWALVPAPDSSLDVEVRLVAAAAPIAIDVAEDSGRPAVGVAVLWPGPDGKPLARATDAAGRVVVDDQPEGVVIVTVGGDERSGPMLRLRAGVDRAAAATLDPPLVVAGRVLDAAGAPAAGVAVGAVGAAGDEPRAGRHVRTDAAGAFRWTGRATDRLVLVATAEDGRAVAAEPAWPDARRALVASVELKLPASMEPVEVSLTPKSVGTLRVEPAALALVREAFGADAVSYAPFRGSLSGSRGVTLSQIGFEGPVRVEVAGDAVPEDHIVPAPTAGRPRRLALAPRPAGARSASGPTYTDAELRLMTGTVSGRVRDVDGNALAGITVTTGAERTTTDRDGRFTIPRLIPGERVDFVYGWLDGADTGGVDPARFAPWSAASAKVSGAAPAGGASNPAVPPATSLECVLPRVASVRFQATSGLDGKPLSWLRVVIVDGAGEPRFDGVVAPREGRVRLDGLLAGTSGTLLALAPGLRREVPLALRAGETVDLGEVGLVSGARVEGTVRSLDGAPVRGATIAAIDDGRTEGSGRGLARARDLHLRRTTSRSDGTYVLEGLDPSRPVLLAVYAPGFAPTARQPLLDDQAAGKADVSLARGAMLRARVEDREGKPLDGAAVELRDGRTAVRWLDLVRAAGFGGVVGSSDDLRLATAALWTEDVTSGAGRGLHRVGPLEPGPYDVIVLRPGYKPARVRTTVAPSASGPENPLGISMDTMDLRVVMEPEAK